MSTIEFIQMIVEQTKVFNSSDDNYDVSIFYIDDKGNHCIEHLYSLTLEQERFLMDQVISYKLNVYQIMRSRVDKDDTPGKVRAARRR